LGHGVGVTVLWNNVPTTRGRVVSSCDFIQLRENAAPAAEGYGVAHGGGLAGTTAQPLDIGAIVGSGSAWLASAGSSAGSRAMKSAETANVAAAARTTIGMRMFMFRLLRH